MMLRRMRVVWRLFVFVSIGTVFATWALYGQTAAAPRAALLAPRDVRIELRADENAPKLVTLTNPVGSPWRNERSEGLPAEVEVNGASVPLHWQLKAELCTADARRVVFVYESAQPHLLLRWQWEARAAFGPLEHTIVVENLGDQQIWAPMIDSLRLAWEAGREERQRYRLRARLREKAQASPAHSSLARAGQNVIALPTSNCGSR